MRFDQPIWILLYRVWGHLSMRRRWQFCILLILMLLSSFAEVLSIGAVFPFLGAIIAPEKIFIHPAATWVVRKLALDNPGEVLLPMTILFCIAALMAAAIRLILVWASSRFSYASGADLSFNIYRRTLYQPYVSHCARNSSEVIDGIMSKSSNAIGIVSCCATIIGASIMALSIVFALLSINPLVALVAFGGFGAMYLIIISLTRKSLLADSSTIASQSVQVLKSLQEGLGGVRDVLINGNQEAYCYNYKASDFQLRRAQARIAFISTSPRYVMEALGMLLIAVLAYALTNQAEGIMNAIPVLGSLALGAQRLLPAMQQAYGSWSSIQGGRIALQDTLALLDQPLPCFANKPLTQPMLFEHCIVLKSVVFSYGPQTPDVLNQVNLTITKGARVGFVGATGSGKSTLLDVIAALLQPTQGALEIDGLSVFPSNQRAWQAHIAHVPQTIFLADSSIEENIAFGIPVDQIDRCRVRQAAEKAKISASIEKWPLKYATTVGERGVRLSGGQRQRIGIARALYRQANVIIFDEATSALDSETEIEVMQTIESLGKEITVLIIAHRVSTLKCCTQIVEIGEGAVKWMGSYKELEMKLVSKPKPSKSEPNRTLLQQLEISKEIE